MKENTWTLHVRTRYHGSFLNIHHERCLRACHCSFSSVSTGVPFMPQGSRILHSTSASGSASRPAHVSLLAGTHRWKGHRCEGYCSQNIPSSITNSGCAKMTSALASPSVHAGCKSRTARNRENEANPWGVALQSCHENIQGAASVANGYQGEQNCNKHDTHHVNISHNLRGTTLEVPFTCCATFRRASVLPYL